MKDEGRKVEDLEKWCSVHVRTPCDSSLLVVFGEMTFIHNSQLLTCQNLLAEGFSNIPQASSIRITPGLVRNVSSLAPSQTYCIQNGETKQMYFHKPSRQLTQAQV